MRFVLAAALLFELYPILADPGRAANAATAEDAAPSYAIAYAGRVVGDSAATRFFIDFDRELELNHFLMADPNRLVIDTPPVLFRFTDARGLEPAGLISVARYGTMSAGRSRIVLNLSGPVSVTRFETVAVETGRYRLVVDLAPANQEEFAKAVAAQDRFNGDTAGSAREDGPPPDNVKDRFTVVIDPGHGGIDSGAIGATGVSEKELTLKLALQVRDALLAEGSFDVKLTREADVFLSLNERVAFSRRNHSDLTIAIHADSVGQKFVRGATVYTLSRNASDGLAEELAHSENLSDLVAGLQFDAEDNAVGDILADLTARETAMFSRQFAGVLVAQLEGKVALIKNPRRSAAFRVLKTAEVPAILLELGYLSNPEDEKHMTDPAWQAMIAKEVAAATRAFFQGREPN